MGAALLHTYFINKDGQKVLIYVPTEAMWQLARSQQVKRILAMSNLWRFFKLTPWGPDYQRAWELKKTLNKPGQATLTGFDGNPVQVTITPRTVKEALYLDVGVILSLGNITKTDKHLVSPRDRPTFAQLRHQKISIPLQLYMQYFGMSLTQNYTMPELRVALLMTKAFEDPEMLTFDLSEMILKNIQRK